jgi:uncharacterized membrane protein (GlpM family)
MAELLLGIAWKALSTALAVVLVAKLGERGGPLLASVVMTFPMNAGPGFFFVALDQPTGFVAAGALISFATTGAVLAFVAVYVRIARRAGFAPGLAAAASAWLAGALLTAALPRSLPVAAVLIALGIGLVRLLGTTRAVATPPILVRAGLGFLVFRGLLAGMVVAVVAELAGVLGPTVAGLAYAFPTMMLASLWVLDRQYGPDFALATMARVPGGLSTYASFCLVLHLGAGPLPGLAAWALAVVVAIAVAMLRAQTGRIRIPRP